MPWAVIATSALFGAFVGSFLNVCVYRLPRNQSVAHPPSRCLSCGTRLAWYDNLPLLGWVLLRGRCRSCGTRYGVRYVGMELLVAALTAVVCARVVLAPRDYVAPWLSGFASEPVALAGAIAAVLVLGYYILVSALIDLEHLIIPDELTKSLQVAAPFLAALTAVGYAFGWSPFEWLVRRDSIGYPLGTSPRFCWWFGGIVAGTLVFLAASLPFARWVYDRYCANWTAEDHRGFRIGVRWFMATLVPPTLVALALAWWSPLPASGPRTAAVIRLWLAAGLANAVLGAITGWLAPYLISVFGTAVFRRYAMGFGDVKFLAPIGAFLGPIGVVYAFFLAAVCGSLVGIPMRFLARRREIPFGPYLALGALISAAVGPRLHALLFHLR